MTKATGGWLDRVRAGAFDAVPETLAWQNSHDLARLIDGYDLAEEAGIVDVGEFAYRKRLEAEARGEWIGTASELWSILYMEHRAARFARIAFDRDPCLDKLCQTLRFALQIVGHEERALLLRLLERERARTTAANDTGPAYALAGGEVEKVA
ncbi:MAG TPA: hypothetical protein VGU45_03680 [Microvirga sp.]|jgi:hypothetical protein|nr:hypothetical protein [Microvirga sp.]